MQLKINKYKMVKNNILKASLLFLLFTSIYSLSLHTQTANFCWKNTKPRGAGTIPNQCDSNSQKVGLLCYKKCDSNKVRSGVDCHSKCPDGWRDDGLFCRLEQYGRGAGYPWRGSDGFSSKGMKRRCQKDHGSGNCQKDGAIYYPKCRSGYDNVGCCICRPNTPDCSAHGLGGRFDLSCAKKIDVGTITTANCPSGKEKQAGLCYQSCPNNYKGVGPVCWGQNPNGWVSCGLGSSTTSAACASIIFDQVASIGNIALTVATLGTSAAADAAADAAKLAEMRQKFEQIKRLYDISTAARELMDSATQASIQSSNAETITAEDIVRLTMSIAAILDPTGVADLVASYTYSTCDKITS